MQKRYLSKIFGISCLQPALNRLCACCDLAGASGWEWSAGHRPLGQNSCSVRDILGQRLTFHGWKCTALKFSTWTSFGKASKDTGIMWLHPEYWLLSTVLKNTGEMGFIFPHHLLEHILTSFLYNSFHWLVILPFHSYLYCFIHLYICICIWSTSKLIYLEEYFRSERF